MIIVGVTGSIGMGKSMVAWLMKTMFRLPVWDADNRVRFLLDHNKKVYDRVLELFPEAETARGVNRAVIRAQAFQDVNKLDALERLLYPLLKVERHRFYAHCRQMRQRICVIDVPLLFEHNIDRECDVTLVISAPFLIQCQRVLRRPGLTKELMVKISERQIPDALKKRKATLIFQTGLGRRRTFLDIQSFIESQYERDCFRHRNYGLKTRRRPPHR